MDASETIEHFQNMGVLDDVIKSASGKNLVIMASAPDGYAFRCMKDFQESESYYKGKFGIDAVTTDNVTVNMTFID